MIYRYRPIILIGAARSGTKLVRDMVAQHPDIDRVPYDVNYLWRLGNGNIPHDELPLARLSPSIRQRIIKHLNQFSANSPFLIEKTVSNCLRVPFVYGVFPDALFIHLVRDGRDVIESSYRQWTASPDLAHILHKVRSFPIIDAFEYAVSYGTKTIRQLLVPDPSIVGTWGPRYEGIDDDILTKDVIEVCAIQWTRSVEKALAGLALVPKESVLTIHYEEFVQDPYKALHLVAEFVGIKQKLSMNELQRDTISRSNIGKGIENLTSDQVALIEPYIKPVLEDLGYTSVSRPK